MQALNTTGIAVSALFIFFIFNKKRRIRADYLLVLINLLTISFLAIDLMVRIHLTPILFFLQTITPYFLFPLFLFFALDVLQEEGHQRGRWMLLFLPAMLSATYFFFELFIVHHYTTDALQSLYEEPLLIYHFFYKGNQIYFLIILVWILRKLRQHAARIKDNFSFTDPIRLEWLKNSTRLYLAITVVSLLIFLTSNFNLLNIDVKSAYSVVSVSVVLAVFYISFHGIRQYSIAEYYGTLNQAANRSSVEEVENLEISQAKYKSSSLTLGEQQIIYQNLLQAFEKQKLYLEPKLQLQEVADILRVTGHALSQTINSIAGKPFYDFVNGYRVRHLEGLLKDRANKRLTILALSMDSGFNSKASLNRVFKEETGLSPKEYQVRNLPK